MADRKDELRKRALSKLEQRIPDSVADLNMDEINALLHELRVHQVELEIQNEELVESQSNLAETGINLEKSHARYMQLYHEAPVGYVTLDDKGIVTQANQFFADMIGIDLQHIEYKPFINHIHEDSHAVFRARFKALAKNPANKKLELLLKRMNAGPLPVLLEGRQVDWADLKVGEFPIRKQIFVSITDVSMLKEVEAELTEAKKQAEQASNAKSEFLSRMSHELRTPLNAILGFGQILEMDHDQISSEHASAVDHIMEGGRHLLNLINEVLDIAKVDSGNVELNIEPVSASRVLNESIEMVRPLADEKNVRFDLLPAADCHIHADSRRLKQVVVNLLSNAIKYNKPGGSISVSCQAGRVDRKQQQHIRISVSDSGIGIKKEDFSSIFEPFIRLKYAEQTESGTGIGLTISKKFVELMQGQIGFSSEYGKGSVFWFEMPISEGEEIIGASVPGEQNHEQAPKEKPKTILYVEDNEDNLILVECIINDTTPYQLLQAKTAEEGIEIAKKERPDLILMDIDLPGINGFEALQQLKADPQTSHINVMAVSAHAMPDDVKKAKDYPFHTYITKPFDIIEFRQQIDEVLIRD